MVASQRNPSRLKMVDNSRKGRNSFRLIEATRCRLIIKRNGKKNLLHNEKCLHTTVQVVRWGGNRVKKMPETLASSLQSAGMMQIESKMFYFQA